MASFLGKIFGTKNNRELKRMGKVVKAINALEESTQQLSDDELLATTQQLRARIDAGETLDALLPEAFAAVRESSSRRMGMRHFDVQMIGGLTLHEGRIAEMRTGEGKTLVATLASYLNALAGPVHVVTVNDYLARRDSSWMSPVFEGLGMTVGVVYSGQSAEEKRAAYAADITYGTNNEFGFDYLRDNMAFTTMDKFQRGLNYAIVDEVDSILIDEARTPLIISGPAEASTELYKSINVLIPSLSEQEITEADPEGLDTPGDYRIDEKQRQVELTEAGHEKVEAELIRMGLLEEGDSLYASSNLATLAHVQAALRAHTVFKRDVDYMVTGGQVVIVDEHTGRAMPGRRWSDGLHQAVEAKEGVEIQNETQTLASTTFQNYFRLYNKLSGMTGTADTEAFEFRQIYGLDVVVIPTHQPMVRKDYNDLVYLTLPEKYDAIVEDITECVEAGRPVLVGTASIESSELLSSELKRRKIEHSVLNAKQHEREADIIAGAGRPGVVTIATNMAGRGTDIVLGGNLEAQIEALGENPTEADIERVKQDWQARHDAVLEAGGLHVIGTERHESRRIDNQLRGRCGRQGDAGSTRFFLSMEDNLMRIFASDRMRSIMQSIGMEKGEAIEARMVNNAVERAQRKVEGHNFDMRKNLLEYDDVANDQRQVIYSQRNELMESDDISEMIAGLRAEVVANTVAAYIPPQSIEEQWDVAGLEAALQTDFGSSQPVQSWLDADDEMTDEQIVDKVLEQIEAEAAAKEAEWAEQNIDMRQVEKQLMLQVLDQRWKEHLAVMDHLRQGISLRAYAQKQPKQEYKRESFALFQELLENIKTDVVRLICRIQIEQPSEVEQAERERRQAAEARMRFSHDEASALNLPNQGPTAGGPGRPEGTGAPGAPPPAEAPETFVRGERKVGRNEPCPCGSGKKYKQCHGRQA
ncbi:MAG: preprotein translocase subunit SecA [Pseudomonadaceae bacterium]|nr:preprotein translocase subunit SecA [Pseudomonadaceae bacterium]